MEKTEREKFDQKLQLFYSNQRSSSIKSSMSTEGPETLASLIEDHCVDTLALREANYSARRRISDLESELAELKAKKDAETSILQADRRASGNALLASTLQSVSKPTADQQLEQNRVREREAALAIAEHDSILIKRLEDEMIGLKSQHDRDLKLINDAVEKVTYLLSEVAEKERRISEQDEMLTKQDIQLKKLTTHMQGAQQLIKNGIRDHQLILEYAASNKMGISNQKPDLEKRKALHCLTNKQSSRDSNDDPLTSKTIFLPPQPLTGNSDNLLSTELRKLSSKGSPNSEHTSSNIEHELRLKNAQLQELLMKERALLKWQEMNLIEVRASAEELTLLEAEEIARLEMELESCFIEKVDWESKCKLAKLDVMRLQRQLEIAQSRTL